MRFTVVISALIALLISFVVVVGATDAIHNDPVLDEAILTSNGLFLDARFDEGIALIYQLEKSRPNDPAVSFFMANGYWWKIFREYIYDKEAKTPDFDKYFEYYIEQTIDRSEDLLDRNKKDIRGLFYLGNAYSLRSRVKGLRGSYFSAGREAAKGKGYLEQVLKFQPNQYDAYYNVGVYNYLAGTLPGYAKVLKAFLFLPGGSKQKGLDYLKTASQKSAYFGPEAKLILARFYGDHEDRPMDALRIVEEFHAKHPDNPWFHYWRGTLYSDEINDYARAIAIYNEILRRSAQGHTNYTEEVKTQAWLKLARCYSRQFDPDKAIVEIKALIAARPKAPTWILPRAYLELGNIYDQIGMHSEALVSYRQVLKFEDYRDYHEQAKKLLSQNYDQTTADIYRMNLDGRRLANAGKYDQAQKAFDKVMKKYPNNVQTLFGIAEMHYLKGAHIEAANILNKLVRISPKEPKWLVPAAYVKLGQIYQAGEKSEAARISYQKALDAKSIASDDRNTAKRALRAMAKS